MARRLAEVLANYGIRHANVVEVFDLGCEDDGLVWQRMELLEGHSIGSLLARYGKLSPLYAIDIVIEAAWGLQAAHDQQVILSGAEVFAGGVTASPNAFSAVGGGGGGGGGCGDRVRTTALHPPVGSPVSSTASGKRSARVVTALEARRPTAPGSDGA